jgi:hypothetical protein
MEEGSSDDSLEGIDEGFEDGFMDGSDDGPSLRNELGIDEGSVDGC